MASLITFSILILPIEPAIAGPAVPPGLPCPPPFPSQSGTPNYTNSTQLSNFTDTVVPNGYGTFVAGNSAQSIPYTPTTAILAGSISPPRIIATGSPCSNIVSFSGIIVEFTNAVSQVLVFPSLDHLNNHSGNGNGSFGWDAYQYAIWGLTINSSNSVVNQKLLFDPTSLFGTDDPTGLTDPHYTLDTWYGTGPTSVNNSLTPGSGNGNGVLGYEAYFDFGTGNAFKFFGFSASTLALGINAEREAEISAVAQALPVSEPTAFSLVGICLAILSLSRRRTGKHRKNPSTYS